MRILLLNQTFYPDVASTAQHLSDLARALVQAGHEVTVVASRRAYDNPDQFFSASECWEGIEIRRVKGTGLGKAAKWRRAVDFASFIVLCCFELLSIRRPDVVVALTSPPLISFLGGWLAKLRGSRFIYWVMDLNPDEAIAAGWLSERSVTTRILQAMSQFSFRQANTIVALDRFMKQRIVAKGIPSEKVEIIAPWAHDDAVKFDSAARQRFRSEHCLTEKFVIMYSGNHSPCHPLDTLLDAANALAPEPQFQFCFVGGGSEFAKVKRFAATHRLTNITCLPYQPLSQLAASLSSADLHVVVMGNAFVGTIHPCKIYNILIIGAPVLYIGPSPSHLSDLRDACQSSQGFIGAQHGDVDAVITGIRGVAASRGRLNCDSLAARFSKENLLPRMLSFFDPAETSLPKPSARVRSGDS